MNTNSVKQSVIQGYGELAKSTKSGLFSRLFTGCAPSGNAVRGREAVGYAKEDLARVSKKSNLGIACGTSSALAQVAKTVQAWNGSIDSEEAKDIASIVASISTTAAK